MANNLQQPGQIFISYRRADAAPAAGRLYDYLATRFGESQVFMDVATIQPGMDFAEAIKQAVRSSQIILVLIGPQWLSASYGPGHRRIDDPDDYVRLEIETALRAQIPTIPVLIDGAQLPKSQDLPAEIGDLARRQAVSINHANFRDGANRVITFLGNFAYAGVKQAQEPRKFLVPRKRIFVSYSHEDDYWLGRLLVHLRPLEREGRIEPWSDREIRPGDEWKEEIRKAIEACQAAVLLISADFMASDFINDDELTPLLEAAKEEGVRIIPLLVSSSSYEDSSLARFQAVNSPSDVLDLLSKGQQEVYFLKTYKAVKGALNPNP